MGPQGQSPTGRLSWDFWPEEDKCICVGWSRCDDSYTRPSGSVHQDSEVGDTSMSSYMYTEVLDIPGLDILGINMIGVNVHRGPR